MAIDFPNSPSLNDYFESNGKAWTFNGTSWDIVQTPANLSIANGSITAPKLAPGVAVANIGYTPANVASPTFTGAVVLPSTTSIGDISSTELSYIDGVTSAIQTQLNAKAPSASPTFTGTVTVSNDLTVTGNLTVNGTNTILNTETLSIEDNIIVLNSNVSASPILNAGIEVERGTSSNVLIRWNETNGQWEFTNDGTTYGDIAALGTIELGTDTIGNFVSDITQGTGVTVTHTPGEGSSPTIAIGQEVGTSASVTFANVTANLIGNVTGNASTVTNGIYTSSSINALADVDTVSASPTSGQFLKWNGTNWVPDSVPTINALDDIGNVSASAPTSGDFLKWNGSAWVNDAVDLGTDTTGNYMTDLTQGTGVTITHTPSEGSNATIAIGQSVATSASVTFANVSSNLVGNVTGNLTGDVTGNSDTATALETARTISIIGDVSGSVSFNGSADATITATIQPNSVALGTDTTGNSDNVAEGTTNLYFTDGRARTALLADNAGTASGIRFIAPNTGTVELISHEATRFVRVTSNAAAGGGKTEIQGSAEILASSSISDPGHLTVAGSVTVGGGVVFEGATANDYETSLVATDPTADRTITLPNADGTVALAGSIALGTDTTGNYMSDLTQGTGVTITHTPGEGSNATIAIGQAVATSSSVSFGRLETSGDVVVGGNLTVNGTTTTLNTETLSIEDNIVVLNSNVTGSPTTNAGIEVERGTSPNVAIRWNETSDKWEFTDDGSTYYDIASEDFVTSLAVSTLDDLSNVSASAPADGEFLKYVSASSVWVPASIPTINALDDIGDVSASVASPGQFLKWNGTAWVPETIIGGATISDSAPAGPLAGQLWFDSTVGKTFVYYDSQWIEVGGVGTGARMVSSSSAPASPLEGSMWFDTDTAQTFVYYDSSWIEIGASGITASVQDSAPAAPVSGQIWFNSLTGGTYVYYGTNWIEVGASPFSALVNTINAKGDLLVGTADNTLGGLTAGSAGQVLTVDSSTATGLKWATPVSTGKAIAMSIVFGG